jgi:tRNA(adenine34) deaminase
MSDYQKTYMAQAIDQAKNAQAMGEVPIGAVVVRGDAVIGVGHNQPIAHNDPTLHAEIVAIRDACSAIDNYRLTGCTLYVTLEPCPMCLGAMLYARIKNVYFGAYDKKLGAVTSVYQLLDAPQINHRMQWQGGCEESVCRDMLQAFFKKRR